MIPQRLKTTFGKVKSFQSEGSFRLAANLLRPATVSVCKNRKISNYSQQPSPLRQLLQSATSVNEALSRIDY